MKKLAVLVLSFLLCFSCFSAMADDDFSWLYEEEEEEEEKADATFTIVTFGTWEQDNNTDNGAEPIQWYVINNTKEKKVLLLSVYALDAAPFQNEHVSRNWAGSSLRTWMNKTFLKSAFTEEEQKQLVTTKVINNLNHCAPDWPGSIGSNSNDRVFLLSYREIYVTYLKDDKAARVCEPTPYAVAQGVLVEDENTNACYWWTRTMGNYKYMRVFVQDDGDYEQIDM